MQLDVYATRPGPEPLKKISSVTWRYVRFEYSDWLKNVRAANQSA